MTWTFLDMGPEIKVLLENASRGDAGVILIIKTDELREGYTKYHVISSTDGRERVILRFHGAQ